MDKQRFDNLTKALASGQSRRSVLKGLLGLGGAAAVSTVALSETDARRSKFTLPPVTTTTPEPPCPDGTHSCDTNATGCCANCDDDSLACGYECCDSADACCDNECCPSDEVCVARKLDCSNNLCEERCCLDSQICDGRCCAGTCFTPLDSDLTGYDRDCCPPIAGFTFCPGTGDYSDQGLCCSGETPDCCNDADGRPVCLTEEQCCTREECRYLDDAAQCLRGHCDLNFNCDQRSVCESEENCCQGGDNVCCPQSQECCGPLCCADGLTCCPDTGTCIDPETQCCTVDDCDKFEYSLDCVTCDTSNTCVPANLDQQCGGVDCYRCSESGQCNPVDAQCDDGDICTTDQCLASGCSSTPIPNCCKQQSDCDQSETCYQNTCVTCQSEEQVCAGKCGQFTSNCGEQFTCTCPTGAICRGVTCVTCETVQQTCQNKCGLVSNNCGQQIECGGCNPGSCVNNACICDENYQCTACGIGTDACCADKPYCNRTGTNSNTCGVCITTISSCSCTLGGSDCCPGLTCVEGTNINFNVCVSSA